MSSTSDPGEVSLPSDLSEADDASLFYSSEEANSVPSLSYPSEAGQSHATSDEGEVELPAQSVESDGYLSDSSEAIQSHATSDEEEDKPVHSRSPSRSPSEDPYDPAVLNRGRGPGDYLFYAMKPRLKRHFRTKWIPKFISSRGNEYFCEIDEEYLTDRFNLTGLNTEVPYYQYALDLVTDVFDLDADDDLREQIEKSARHLYGLVHARYIVTTRGLAKMVDKYKKGDFGKCPRVVCEGHPLLPMGQHDVPNTSTVRLYCGKCEDIYNPKSSRHASIDGAYFGTSFHSMLFQVYPALVPEKSVRRYEPRIYGFRVHAAAALARWQDQYREDTKAYLRDAGVDAKYVDDSEEEEEDDEEEVVLEPSVTNAVAPGSMDVAK